MTLVHVFTAKTLCCKLTCPELSAPSEEKEVEVRIRRAGGDSKEEVGSWECCLEEAVATALANGRL